MRAFLTVCLVCVCGLTYFALDMKAQHQVRVEGHSQGAAYAQPHSPQRAETKPNTQTKPHAETKPHAQSNAKVKAAPSAQPSSRPSARPLSRPTSRPAYQQGQHQAQHQGQHQAQHQGQHQAQHQPTSMSQGQFGGFIYGQIDITDEMKAKVKPGSVLFVIVRRYAEQGKGMLIAATKLDGVTQGSFPLRYVVKQQDAMMGAPLTGKVTVSARIDQDGDAISKQPNDVIGEAATAVMVGVNPVVIQLNSAVK